MAIDTENKRRAAYNAGELFVVYPVPDGSISTVDRRHIAGCYRYPSGIPAVGGPYDVVVGEVYTPGAIIGEVYTPGARTGEVNS
jgi:hypothetical protein